MPYKKYIIYKIRLISLKNMIYQNKKTPIDPLTRSIARLINLLLKHIFLIIPIWGEYVCQFIWRYAVVFCKFIKIDYLLPFLITGFICITCHTGNFTFNYPELFVITACGIYSAILIVLFELVEWVLLLCIVTMSFYLFTFLPWGEFYFTIITVGWSIFYIFPGILHPKLIPGITEVLRVLQGIIKDAYMRVGGKSKILIKNHRTGLFAFIYPTFFLIFRLLDEGIGISISFSLVLTLYFCNDVDFREWLDIQNKKVLLTRIHRYFFEKYKRLSWWLKGNVNVNGLFNIHRIWVYRVLCTYVFVAYVCTQDMFLLALLYIIVQLKNYQNYIDEPIFYSRVGHFDFECTYTERVHHAFRPTKITERPGPFG